MQEEKIPHFNEISSISGQIQIVTKDNSSTTISKNITKEDDDDQQDILVNQSSPVKQIGKAQFFGTQPVESKKQPSSQQEQQQQQQQKLQEQCIQQSQQQKKKYMQQQQQQPKQQEEKKHVRQGSIGQRFTKDLYPMRTIPSIENVKYTIFTGNAYSLLKSGMAKLRPKWIEIAQDQGFQYSHFVWKPTHFTPVMYESMSRKDDQVPIRSLNHIQNIRGLTTKTGLVRSLKLYYKRTAQAMNNRYGVWQTMPTSYILTPRIDDFQYSQFCARFKQLAKGNYKKQHVPAKHCDLNMWLVKPAAMNQGKGIQIFKNLMEIQSYIGTKTQNSLFVVQKYLEKPLLYHNYKFDIRVWAVITWKNQVLFYNDGYLRLASYEFSNDSADVSVHLTNQMLQKKYDNFGANIQGNSIGFNEFQDYLNEKHPGANLNFQRDFVTRMKDIVIDCFLSVKKQINPNKRRDVFELFGFDFMIDQDLRLWLIEINTNPSLSMPPNDHCRQMFPRMVQQMYKMFVIPTIQPNFVPIIEETSWDLLYCQANSKFSSVPVNKRNPFNSPIYPIPQLQQKQSYGPKYGGLNAMKFHSKNQSLNISTINASMDLTQANNASNSIIINESKQLPAIQKKVNRLTAKKIKNTFTSYNNHNDTLPSAKLSESSRNNSAKMTKSEKVPQHKRSKYALYQNNTTSNTIPSSISASIQFNKSIQKTLQFEQQSDIIHSLHQRHIDNKTINEQDDESIDDRKEQTRKHHSVHNSLLISHPLKQSRQQNMSFILKKDIFQQTREMLTAKPQRKQAIQLVFKKLCTKFTHWDLNDDKQKQSVIKSMNYLYNLASLQYLSSTSDVEKVIQIMLQQQLPTEYKLCLSTCLYKLSRVMGMKGNFFHASNLGSYLSDVITMAEITNGECSSELSQSEVEILETNLKVLCQLCSVQSSKFYIPGETGELLRAQKEATDAGIFITLFHLVSIANDLKGSVGNIIQTQFMQHLKISDLQQQQECLKNFSSSSTNLLRNQRDDIEQVLNKGNSYSVDNKPENKLFSDFKSVTTTNISKINLSKESDGQQEEEDEDDEDEEEQKGNQTPYANNLKKNNNDLLSANEKSNLDGSMSQRQAPNTINSNKSAYKKYRKLGGGGMMLSNQLNGFVHRNQSLDKKNSNSRGNKSLLFMNGPVTRDALAECHLSQDLICKVNIPSIKRMISQKIAELHQDQQQRIETEARKRIQKMEQDQKIRLVKEKQLVERRKKADQMFKKRVEENKRRTEELAKKDRLEKEQRLQMEEQRKKKLLELAKKRQQDRRQQRLEEIKKKQEDQSKRNQDLIEEQQLDDILISGGFDLKNSSSPVGRLKQRKSSLPINTAGSNNKKSPPIQLQRQNSQQNLIEIVAYTPKNKNIQERFNHTPDKVNTLSNNKQQHTKPQTKSRQDRSADRINNLYFEFHSNEETAAGDYNDYSNVVFCGKSKQNQDGLILIKQQQQQQQQQQQKGKNLSINHTPQPKKLNEFRSPPPQQSSTQAIAQPMVSSLSPEVARLILNSATSQSSSIKENLPKRILGNTASKQSLASKQKKNFQNQILSKNEQRVLQIYHPYGIVNPQASKKKSVSGNRAKKLSMKNSLGKDSLVSGEILIQSPEPMSSSQILSQEVDDDDDDDEDDYGDDNQENDVAGKEMKLEEQKNKAKDDSITENAKIVTDFFENKDKI